MKRLIGLVLVVATMFVCVSAIAEDAIGHLNNAMAATQIRSQIDGPLVALVEKAKRDGGLSELDVELLYLYYSAHMAIMDISHVELEASTSSTLSESTRTVISSGEMLVDIVKEMKEKYSSGQGTWADTMGVAVNVIDANLSAGQ